MASEHFAARSKGQPTFINLDAAYPHQVFTILIWDEDLRRVGYTSNGKPSLRDRAGDGLSG